jgi:predicted transcriptional regulator
MDFGNAKWENKFQFDSLSFDDFPLFLYIFGTLGVYGDSRHLPTRFLDSAMHFWPTHRPQKLSLGPLELEILEILWSRNPLSVKEIHDQLLDDPDRELAYASVTTVLRRLANKGWLKCDSSSRVFLWQPLVSREQAHMLQAHSHLQEFLALGTPEVVAACFDALDPISTEQLESIAQRIEAIRQARESQK